MKSYRLLEITTQYDLYLREFYNQHKDFDKWSYDELYAELMEDAFAEADYIHRELNQMGIESKIAFCNNRNLQRKWKSTAKEMSLFDILILQIKDYRPDVILISDMCYFSQEETKLIKACLEPKKINLVGFHFTLINNEFRQRATLYDQIYTGNKAFVYAMREFGLSVYLLRHAFETSILERVPERERKNAICFPGSIFIGENAHNNRVEMIYELIKEKIPYDFYGNIYGSAQELASADKNGGMMSIASEMIRNRKEGVFGINYYETLSRYNICLNLHALCCDDYGAGNMRMFEATGMGTCLLTDKKGENQELFDVGKEIVVYESFDDMVEKARWLIEHPQKAREIALAGQKRTLKDYTYKNKAEYLNEYIQMLMV